MKDAGYEAFKLSSHYIIGCVGCHNGISNTSDKSIAHSGDFIRHPSEFYEENLYKVNSKKLTGDQIIDYYIDLVNRYPIISIEDPFDENDFDSFAK